MGRLDISSLRKNKEFDHLYSKLLLGKGLDESDMIRTLETAILFINCRSADIQSLGYRMIVLYSCLTKDFIPLYDVSLSFGYYPISQIIDSKSKIQIKNGSFLQEMQRAYIRTFTKEGITFTHQQQVVRKAFLKNNADGSCAVIAPTSYGKSDLIISSLRMGGNVCIIVPTKALIAQTKKRILDSKGISSSREIITHHEMYSDADKDIIAILTQERLLRLLHQNLNLVFDVVHIDEAHNLLEDSDRNRLLAISLILIRSRCPSAKLRFFTPFLKNANSLKLNFLSGEVSELKITENVKSEKYFLKDFRKDIALCMYDQYMNTFLPIAEDGDEVKSELDLIKAKSAKKNIIYINKPSGVNDFSLSMIEKLKVVDSEDLDAICDDIKEYVHEEYSLVKCLKRGLVYHHGSMPDGIRLFVERLYSKSEYIRYIATTSTLLEGVNIPAEKLFVLSNKKGSKKLSPSQFKNLVGRVCRFSEIFGTGENSLNLLSPEIYIVGGKYTDKKANLLKFVKEVAKVDIGIEDKIENVLLENANVAGKEKERNRALDIIENLSPGAIEFNDVQYAKTKVGSLCYENNVLEFNIHQHESNLQTEIDDMLESAKNLSDPMEILDVIDRLFLSKIEDANKYRNLLRLRSEDTRRFYAYFINMKMNNWTYSRMIKSFLSYWDKMEGKSRPYVYVGSWGEESIDKFSPNFRHWIDLRNKSFSERVNLAIVRVKEEQEFIDNVIMKFVEILSSLDIIDPDTYLQIRYGTSDHKKIAMLKSGVSASLSNLIFEKYSDFVDINKNGKIRLNRKILQKMSENDENRILMFEASYNVRE